MKTLFAGVALATLIGTNAFAVDFYIVQDPTKRCRNVEQRSAAGIGIVTGQRGIALRPDAEITC